MPGFIFWGLFVCLGVIVISYILWMYTIEKKK